MCTKIVTLNCPSNVIQISKHEYENIQFEIMTRIILQNIFLFYNIAHKDSWNGLQPKHQEKYLAIHEFRIMRSFERSESYLKAGISDILQHISQNSVRNLTLCICKELIFVATVVSWLMSAFIKVGLEYNRELGMVTVALYKTRLR